MVDVHAMQDNGTSEDDISHDSLNQSLGTCGRVGKENKVKETKRAAAALCVGVGHFCDPDELPGLSHYLEHMLFMGSKKYPDENEYDAYLNKHNGSSNAFTEEETTTFYFECTPSAFHGALDRFAQFFVAPLIKSDALDREVRAVDSEFSGVLQSDSCRLSQARTSTLPAWHPASKFGWGNKLSLQDRPLEQGIDIRKYLLNYYKEHYTANRMSLVVISGEDFASMKSCIESCFSAVPGGSMVRPRFDNLQIHKIEDNVFILPTSREDHKISISFHLPSSLEREYGKKAEDYVSHLVGHEGKGSLLTFLKQQDWATELCAGITEQTSAFWLFEVTITLTEKGLHAGAGFGTCAAQALFGYLDMLSSSGPQKWIWDEMKSISKIKWDYLEEEEPSEYVSQIAGDLHVIPMHHVLTWSFLHEEFDPSLIGTIMELLVPEKAQFYVQTHAYDELSRKARSNCCINGVKTKFEPWFGFEFVQGRLDDTALMCDSGKFDFHLPKSNPYIAKTFNLVAGDHATEVDTSLYPKRIHIPEAANTTFHLMDAQFQVPKISSVFRFMHGIPDNSSRHIALTHILIKLVEDILCEEAYLADMAGLHYSMYMDGHCSIDIRIEGFDEKVFDLTSLIFSTFKRLQYTEEDFNRIKEVVHRHYSNTLMKPTKHASFLRIQTLRHHHADPRDIIEDIKSIQNEDIRYFAKTLTSKGHLTSLIIGNCTEEQAKDLSRLAISNLGFEQSTEITSSCCRVLKVNDHILRREATVNPQEKNSCVEYYIQLGSALSARNRSLLDLVDQLIYEPCYNVLRTQKQLGYIVNSGTRLTHGVQGLCITIQSKTCAAAELEHNIATFLTDFSKTLESMSPEEFQTHKNALIEHKRSKATTLSDLCERHWDALVNRAAEFEFRQADIDELQRITQMDLIHYYNENISPEGSKSKTLVTHVDPQSRHHHDAPARACIITKETLASYHEHEASYPPLPIVS